jgi:hypothetical protein
MKIAWAVTVLATDTGDGGESTLKLGEAVFGRWGRVDHRGPLEGLG